MRRLFYYMGATLIAVTLLVGRCAKDNYANARLKEFPMFGEDSSSLDRTLISKNGRALKTDEEGYAMLRAAAMKKLGDKTGRALTSFSIEELLPMITEIAEEADSIEPYGKITKEKIRSLDLR